MNKKQIQVSNFTSSHLHGCKLDKCQIELLQVATSIWSYNWASWVAASCVASSGFCKPACGATGVID